MKTLWLMIFLAFSGLLAFGDTKEIDFLLFQPNSSNQFVDEEQAAIQLDNTAKYLKSRNPDHGKVFVYGYAADVANEIEPVGLSRDRAVFVINEIQRRGLSRDIFSAPVGYGSVNLWGDNTSEGDRSLNRRVRILLDDTVLTPSIVQTVEPLVEQEPEPELETEPEKEEPRYRKPWWLLLLLPLGIIAALISSSPKRKKNPSEKPVLQKAPEPKPVPQEAHEPKPVQATATAVPDATVPSVKNEKIKILGEDEIRVYAYGLYIQRNFLDGSDIEDWFQSIRELTAYYEGRGYRVLLYWSVQ
jgi:hypothetical protein